MMGDLERVRDLYSIIINGALPDSAIDMRVAVVRELERLTASDFKHTADFTEKVEAFIRRGGQPGAQLVEARKLKRWSQRSLAAFLGVSHQYVGEMENGRKPLTDMALGFVRAQGV